MQQTKGYFKQSYLEAVRIQRVLIAIFWLCLVSGAHAQTVKLSRKNLKEIPWDKIGSGTRELDLRRNKLQSFPQELGRLDSLKSLRLAGNPLSFPDTLMGFNALEYLDLWDAHIRQVPKVVMGFENLKTLDLRNTFLDESDREKLEKVFPSANILLTERCDCRPKRW